jgi:hypothetical protein
VLPAHENAIPHTAINPSKPVIPDRRPDCRPAQMGITFADDLDPADRSCPRPRGPCDAYSRCYSGPPPTYGNASPRRCTGHNGSTPPPSTRRGVTPTTENRETYYTALHAARQALVASGDKTPNCTLTQPTRPQPRDHPHPTQESPKTRQCPAEWWALRIDLPCLRAAVNRGDGISTAGRFQLGDGGLGKSAAFD